MYYVTDPDAVVANIHSMIDSQLGIPEISSKKSNSEERNESEEENNNDTRN